VHEIAERIKPHGNVYSAESWHCYLKSKFLGCMDITLPDGRVMVIPNSSVLPTPEFAKYVDQVEAWAGEHEVYLADVEDAV